MCSECHSTGVRKRYDPEHDTYQTTWSEISVGCEACHGPGSLHVEWAKAPPMARLSVENFALPLKTSGLAGRGPREPMRPVVSCATERTP